MTAKTVLIADDDRDLAAALAIRCESLGLIPQVTHDGMTAVRMIDNLSPDIIILDVNMPGGNGLAVCELITSGDRARDKPIIMLTGESQPETVRRCYEMCAYYVLKCPDVWERIRPILENHLSSAAPKFADAEATSEQPAESVAEQTTPRKPPVSESTIEPASDSLVDVVFSALAPMELARPQGQSSTRSSNPAHEEAESGEPAAWILSIDDDPDMANSLRLRLKEYGIAVRRAYAGMEGYRRAFTEPAQAILLDYEMPNGNGDYVLRRLKENPVTRDIPVVVLTGRREKTIERTMYNLGAAAFLTKPYLWEHLWDALRPLISPSLVQTSCGRMESVASRPRGSKPRVWQSLSREI
jgi:DNA-binding response OmpR family regulator